MSTDLDESRFDALRRSFGVGLTAHEFRLLAQTQDDVPVCLSSSQSGVALVKNKLAIAIDDRVVLNRDGLILRDHLQRYRNEYFVFRRNVLDRLRGITIRRPVSEDKTLWTATEEKLQTELWKSGISAFWLCPDGIREGIRIHDEYLKTGKNPF